MNFVVALLALACLGQAGAQQAWSLTDSVTWTLDNRYGHANVSGVTASIPSCALTELLAGGVLEGDPLYRWDPPHPVHLCVPGQSLGERACAGEAALQTPAFLS